MDRGLVAAGVHPDERASRGQHTNDLGGEEQHIHQDEDLDALVSQGEATGVCAYSISPFRFQSSQHLPGEIEGHDSLEVAREYRGTRSRPRAQLEPVPVLAAQPPRDARQVGVERRERGPRERLALLLAVVAARAHALALLRPVAARQDPLGGLGG